MLPLRIFKFSSKIVNEKFVCNLISSKQQQIFRYGSLSTTKDNTIWAKPTTATVWQKFYSTDIKKENIHIETVKIKDVLQKNKELLQEKKNNIVKDIREKKLKVRERVEEVIERENIFTIPNWLCVGRIAMSPYLGYVIIQSDFSLAMGLLVAAGLSDLADGFIARNWKGQMSNFGSFLDPLADKCLMSTLVVSLSYCELMPIWLAVTILFRDVFLIAAGFVIRWQSLPPPKTFNRYFDATHATAQLAPTSISKVNTAIQLFTVATTLGAPIWDYIDHPYLHGLWYLTGVTTAAAAISYITKKDTYKFLRDKAKKN